MSDASREQKLMRRALDAKIVESRAKHWRRRYPESVDVDDLEGLGNAALLGIVEKYQDALGAFEDYVRRRVDYAMFTGIRVESRHLRLDRAAQRAAADLLALQRSTTGAAANEPGTTRRDRAKALAQAVAAATFVAMAEEAQRDGVEDVIAREELATAMTVIDATLAALTKPQRKLFVMVYRDGKTLTDAAEVLGYHYNTVQGWHANVLDAIREQLEKRGITHAPGRGGAPRVALRVLRGGGANDEGEESDGEEGDGGDEDEEDEG